MATWHITAKPTVGENSTFSVAIKSLALKSVRAQFEQLGFSVSPMPEQHSLALSVSHSLESAITLFMLKHGSEHIVIDRVS